MHHQHCAGIVPALARAELMHHHAVAADRQPMVPGFLHEAGGAIHRPPFAFGQALWIGSPAEQLERRFPADARRYALGGAEQAADDLAAE